MTDSGQGDGPSGDGPGGGGSGDTGGGDGPSGGAGGGVGSDGDPGGPSNSSSSAPSSGPAGSDPDGTSARSGFDGMNADRNSDPANDKGKDAPGYNSVDGSSYYSAGPVALQTQAVSPSLLAGVRGLLDKNVEKDQAVLSVGLAALTAAMPAVGILSTITDIARAMGLSEEPTSFADNSEGTGGAGTGGHDAAGSFRGPAGGSVIVRDPVFLPVGGSGLPSAAASFLGPQSAMAASPAAGADPAAAEELEPIWPLVAAAALIALGAG